MRRDALLAVLFLALFAALTVGLAMGGPLIEVDLAVHRWAERTGPIAGRPGLNWLAGSALLTSAPLAGWLAWCGCGR